MERKDNIPRKRDEKWDDPPRIGREECAEDKVENDEHDQRNHSSGQETIQKTEICFRDSNKSGDR